MTTVLDQALDAPVGFADLGLPDNIVTAVADLGFVVPTAIQAAVVPALASGRDVAGEAQTGTGKTAAFGLPMLARIQSDIDPDRRSASPGPLALVLAPTRELALQLAGALQDYGRNTPGLRVAAVYGGAPYGPQKRELEAGAQIVVGTPGRLADHLARGTFDLSNVRFLVLDEADEMLRMGFAEEVDAIVSQAPADRQTALFSANMPNAIRAAPSRYLRARVWVWVAAGAPAADVTQRWVLVPARHKVEALVRTLATNRSAAIVFVRTRQDAEE
ncbi:MAG: DEAD/DEAH box helicase, partial [Bifidobacteriaceae bacterium]|nr:DEAD/DEAH box helicase [Bifidobacteriaceae bacterium]